MILLLQNHNSVLGVIRLIINKNRALLLLIICIIGVSALLIIFKAQTYYKLLKLNLEGKKYDLYYSPTQLYVDYNGTQYSLTADKNDEFIDLTTGDIDSDGKDEILILVGDKGSTYGNELVIYDFLIGSNRVQIEEIYRNDISGVRPWKIKTCEIDNDGQPEIFIAVNKSTYYYPEVENRPFFFNFKNDMLVKKWTGSKLRAPFTDVYFADLNSNGSDELIVIEEADSEGFVIAVYYWFGFGFILQAESFAYDAIGSVSIIKSKKGIFLETEVKKDDQTRIVILEPSTGKTKNGIYLLKERRK